VLKYTKCRLKAKQPRISGQQSVASGEEGERTADH
jgi:hypothetical protein